jgi:hypothetical protein
MYDFEHVKMVAMWSGAGAVFTAALAILIGAFLRRRKLAALSLLEDEEEVRPKHVPLTYSWEDFWKDVDGQVPTSDIIDKVRWCGMPKRPAPETTTASIPMTITVEGVSAGTGVAGTYIPTPTWVGGMVVPSTTFDPNPPYYNVSNVSGYNGSYYNNSSVTNVYPYGSSYYNTNQNAFSSSCYYGTIPNVVNVTCGMNPNVNVTSSNMASFTHARFTG